MTPGTLPLSRVGAARDSPQREGRPSVDRDDSVRAAAEPRQQDVDGLGALVACLGVVGHLGALGERAVAVADDRLVMDEEVLACLIGGDEAEALLVAEPLDGSCCHDCSLLGSWGAANRGGCMKQQ